MVLTFLHFQILAKAFSSFSSIFVSKFSQIFVSTLLRSPRSLALDMYSMLFYPTDFWGLLRMSLESICGVLSKEFSGKTDVLDINIIV
jgi:hypothetical protein